MLSDLHIHTIASGHAFSTIDEVAKTASEKGLKVIAITDHGPAMPGGAHEYYFWNLRTVPDELYGVRVLKGVEANIIDTDGTLDLGEDILKMLDLVTVALHPYIGYDGLTVSDNTKTLLKVFKNPYVNVLAHPGNPIFPLDYERVIEKALHCNVLMEINNSSKQIRAGSFENCVKIANIINEKKAYTVLGSDAHYKTEVGNLSNAILIAEKGGIPKEKILNYDPDKLLEFLRDKRSTVRIR